MVCVKMYLITSFIVWLHFIGCHQSLYRHLKINLVRIVGMRIRVCVSVCVSVSVPEAINNQWHDMNLIQLVKQVLQQTVVVIVNGRGLSIDTRCRH